MASQNNKFTETARATLTHQDKLARAIRTCMARLRRHCLASRGFDCCLRRRREARRTLPAECPDLDLQLRLPTTPNSECSRARANVECSHVWAAPRVRLPRTR
jgi:hypothetical protein